MKKKKSNAGRKKISAERRKQGRTISLRERDHDLFWDAINELEDMDSLSEFLEVAGRDLARKVLSENTEGDPLTVLSEKVDVLMERDRDLNKKLDMISQQLITLEYRLNHGVSPGDTVSQ